MRKGQGDKIYRILILPMLGIEGHDPGQAITVKSDEDKVLTHKVRVLKFLLRDTIDDVLSFLDVFTKDKVLPLLNHRNRKEVNLIINFSLP